ncbi:hypothetical protein LL912_02885 [Niabella sp. CC-SYL272]|uniref:hypothetical protein n=1 Tax=Niabella agricola TaxID=2891571 RepID=UPI001F3D724D|nr:hypothetical protein [Niabella agricola]MCF3107718.1 hypothetical protein [Niabella agricola]
MMKRYKYKAGWGRFAALLFLACIFFKACRKEDATNNGQGNTYAKFATAETTANGALDSIPVGIRWSQTKWKLSAAPGGFITGFSRETGGGVEQQRILGEAFVRLQPNLTEERRTQEIFIEDLTTGKEEKMVIVQSPYSGVNRFVLNPGIRYQKITGFGGMMNASWAGASQLSVADIDKLYGPDGLGLNIGRLMLYPNPADWSRELAIAKRAQQYGALLFASPWTPPPSMKSANVNSNQNGEYLLPANYGAFAAHLKSYVDYYKDQGIPVYAVSVQNEPDYKVGYDGCSYTPQQMLDFVKGYGRAVGTRLMTAETVQFNKSYTDPLLNDPLAVNNFDIVATHLYGFNFKTTSADYPLAKQHEKEVWVTEHLFNETAKGPDWLWEPSLRTTLAQEIHDCMASNVNAYVYWYLKRYYSFMGEDRDANNPADWYTAANGAITKRGYIIAHYAKYATGRTRIAMTPSAVSPLLATAYAGADDYTVVLTNQGDRPVIMELAIPQSMAAAAAVETNAINNMTPAALYITKDKKNLRLQMSANSMVSVKMQL